MDDFRKYAEAVQNLDMALLQKRKENLEEFISIWEMQTARMKSYIESRECLLEDYSSSCEKLEEWKTKLKIVSLVMISKTME